MQSLYNNNAYIHASLYMQSNELMSALFRTGGASLASLEEQQTFDSDSYDETTFSSPDLLGGDAESSDDEYRSPMNLVSDSEMDTDATATEGNSRS
jgi:hypothetical protein